MINQINKEFVQVPTRYYSVGSTNTNESCTHDVFTVTTRSLGKQATLARICDSCGERRAYIMYAKYSKR
jgi:hypothetical protein